LNGRNRLRVIGAFPCLLFTLSIFFAFLQVQWYRIVTFTGQPGPITFWSFRVTYAYFPTFNRLILTEHWFADYWSDYVNYRTMELGLGMDTVFMLLFVAQVLTVLFAALAIIKVEPQLFLSAAVLNVFTTFFMWLTSRAFVYPHFIYAFRAGFWLTLPTAALFLAAFLVGQADSKLSTTPSSLPLH